MVKFPADENISSLIVKRLRRDGLEIAAIAEIAPGISDSEVLETASGENRILITSDHDFGEMMIRQQVVVGGVVLLKLDRLAPAVEIERVARVIVDKEAELNGNLVVIEPNRVRIRPFWQRQGRSAVKGGGQSVRF